MGAEIQTGEAAPATQTSNPSAGADFSAEMMQGVFGRFGKKLPVKPPAEGAEAQGGERSAETAGDAAAEGKQGEQQHAAEGQDSRQDAAAGAEESAAGAAEKPEAGEGQGAGTEEGQAQGAAADNEHSAETEKVVKAKLKSLPPDTQKLVQSIIDGRLGEVTRKSRQENDRLAGRVIELGNELETAKKDGRVVYSVPGVHPAMLAETPEQINAHEADLEKMSDWLDLHKDTGFQGDPDKGEPSFTAEQIRERMREIRQDQKQLPNARQILVNRTNADNLLRHVMPEYFDAKTDQAAAAQRVLKAMPELRRFANCNVLIAQFLLGQKALSSIIEAKDAAKGGAKAAQGQGKQASRQAAAAAPQKRAPRAPGDGSPARGSVLDDPSRQQPDASNAVKKFTQTRSRADLVSAVRDLAFR